MMVLTPSWLKAGTMSAFKARCVASAIVLSDRNIVKYGTRLLFAMMPGPLNGEPGRSRGSSRSKRGGISMVGLSRAVPNTSWLKAAVSCSPMWSAWRARTL